MRPPPMSVDTPAPGCFAGVEFMRGRLFDSDDLDEVREVCGRVFNPHELRLVGPGQALRARMDHLPVGPMSLNRLTWGARVHVDPDRLGRCGLISIPVRGNACFEVGAQVVEVSPRQACVIDPTQRFRFSTDAQFDQIVLRFERDALGLAWAALSGQAPPDAWQLQPALPLAGSAWHALEPVLHMLACCARGGCEPGLLPHLKARLQDLLLTTLLLQAAPSLAALPPARPPSRPRA